MKCWWLSSCIIGRCVTIEPENSLTRERLHAREKYSSQLSKNMPPITCESDEGSTMRAVDEYKFKTLLEHELRSAHQAKYMLWDIPDLAKFCDRALCGKRSDSRVTGDSRSLCIVYVLEIRCRKETRMKHNEGKSLTMQCFLSQQHGTGVDKYVAKDLMAPFAQMRHDVYDNYAKRSACASFRLPDGHCDFSAAAESGFLKQLTIDHGHNGTLACKQFTAVPNDLTTLQPLTGSIASFPAWLEPPLDCGVEREYSMHILIRARKLRIHFLQSWFLKMENEVFKGNRLWFQKALERYHSVSGNSRDSDTGFSADKEDDSKGTQYEMTKAAVSTNELLTDQKFLDDLDQKMNHQRDYRSPTLSKKKLTGWEYEHAALSSNPSKNWGKLHEAINFDDTLGVKEISNQNLFKPPHPIGGTFWRNYLTQPQHWDKNFWRLISSANFRRMERQQRETEILCEKVRIKRSNKGSNNWQDYRGPLSHINEPINNNYPDGTQYFIDTSACSMALINTRLYAGQIATQEMQTPLSAGVRRVKTLKAGKDPEEDAEKLDQQGDLEEPKDSRCSMLRAFRAELIFYLLL